MRGLSTNYAFSEEVQEAAATAIPAMYGNFGQSFDRLPSRHQHEGNTMEQSRGKTDRTNLGATAPNYSDDDDVIFIAEWARRHSAKKGAKLSGMTAKGFQKLQAGENAISYKKLTRWLKADPQFAAAYAAHVGLILPGEAEFAGALTNAFNARARMGT